MNGLNTIKHWLSRLHLIRKSPDDQHGPLADTQNIGQFYEKQALKYLQKQGLRLIEANFNCRYGELDLIMADADVLVFVEVKFRQSRAYGGAVSAVSRSKQQKLIKTAQWFMQQHQLSNKPARFDVVAIEGENNIHWLKNAFYAN